MKKALTNKNLEAIKKHFNGSTLFKMFFGNSYVLDVDLHKNSEIKSITVIPVKKIPNDDNTFIFDGEYIEKGLLEELIIGQNLSGKKTVKISCKLNPPTW